ncbi:MAG: LuxR family transcriptional regulator [Pseudomonadota bacterium]
MVDVLETVVEQLRAAATLEDLYALTRRLRDHYGIDHVVYHWVNSKGERFGAGTYTQDWIDRYLEKDYLRFDPVIFGCFQRFHPVNWKDLDWSGKSARAFMKDAIDHGVGNQGYSIPIRGPQGQFALFTCSTGCEDGVWEAFIENNQRDLLLIAHEFNRKALDLDDHPLSPPALSPRELSAMTHLAKGLSRAQAAQEMSISEHTLRVYVEAARHKLGALNTTHAVARALSQGIIVV